MFRFTIRDVLWLTVVVALGAAWWIDHNRLRGLSRTLAATEQELRDERTKPLSITVAGGNWQVQRGKKMMIWFPKDGGVIAEEIPDDKPTNGEPTQKASPDEN
jgi:hypothetical protein